MQCPKCGAADTIYENFQELRTTLVLRVGLEGYPVVSDDSDILSSDPYSYNCSDCSYEWDSWEELRAALDGDEDGELIARQGGPEAIADHLANGETWNDGGWEDPSGVAVPTIITAPDCDRTCLSCQGDDHDACGMGCHDEEDPSVLEEQADIAREAALTFDHTEGGHALPVGGCPTCDDAAREVGYAALGIRPGDPRRG